MPDLDTDLRSIQEVRNLAVAARNAQREFFHFSQEQVDKVCAAMAEAAINLLLHKIRRPKDRHVHQAVDHLVPYVLVKRDSVAPPRKP